VLVAVIADTHIPRGSRKLPDACLRELAGSDVIIHAGDVTGAAFLEQLRRIGKPLHAVHGNADEPAVREALPEWLVVEAGGSRIGVVHDAGPRVGREERLVARFAGCDAVVYGHTHQPQVAQHDGTWILNPGSPTERRRAPERTMIVLEIAPGELRPRLLSV
jgi:putative phosphoesterase